MDLVTTLLDLEGPDGRYSDRLPVRGQLERLRPVVRDRRPGPRGHGALDGGRRLPAGAAVPGRRLPASSSPTTCVSDPDATALAVQALIRVAGAEDGDAQDGLDYLAVQQDDTTGAVGGSGPTAAVNANSTGLAGQAFLAGGRANAGPARAVLRPLAAVRLRVPRGPARRHRLRPGRLRPQAGRGCGRRARATRTTARPPRPRSRWPARRCSSSPPAGADAVAPALDCTPPTTTPPTSSTSSTTSSSSHDHHRLVGTTTTTDPADDDHHVRARRPARRRPPAARVLGERVDAAPVRAGALAHTGSESRRSSVAALGARPGRCGAGRRPSHPARTAPVRPVASARSSPRPRWRGGGAGRAPSRRPGAPAAACSGTSGVTVGDRLLGALRPGRPGLGHGCPGGRGDRRPGADPARLRLPDRRRPRLGPVREHASDDRVLVVLARPAGRPWQYSNLGAGSYDPAPGSVEGWSFGAGAPPSVAPHRPVPPPAAPPPPSPSPSGGGGAGGGGGSGGTTPSSGGSVVEADHPGRRRAHGHGCRASGRGGGHGRRAHDGRAHHLGARPPRRRGVGRAAADVRPPSTGTTVQRQEASPVRRSRTPRARRCRRCSAARSCWSSPRRPPPWPGDGARAPARPADGRGTTWDDDDVVTSLPRAVHPGAWWVWALGLADRREHHDQPAAAGAAAGRGVPRRRRAARHSPWARAFRLYLRLGLAIVVVRVVLHVLVGLKVGTVVLLPLPGRDHAVVGGRDPARRHGVPRGPARRGGARPAAGRAGRVHRRGQRAGQPEAAAAGLPRRAGRDRHRGGDLGDAPRRSWPRASSA